MANREENIKFVRLATLALMSLWLERRPARYVVRPPAPSPMRALRAEAVKKQRRDGICGLGLIPQDMRRFWPKVSITEAGCWEWQGFTTDKGYGKFRIGKANRLAHRASYEFFNGILPEGLTLDHLCFNKRCVNPDHLEAVTQAENTRRYHQRMDSAA